MTEFALRKGIMRPSPQLSRLRLFHTWSQRIADAIRNISVPKTLPWTTASFFFGMARAEGITDNVAIIVCPWPSDP